MWTGLISLSATLARTSSGSSSTDSRPSDVNTRALSTSYTYVYFMYQNVSGPPRQFLQSFFDIAFSELPPEFRPECTNHRFAEDRAHRPAAADDAGMTLHPRAQRRVGIIEPAIHRHDAVRVHLDRR